MLHNRKFTATIIGVMIMFFGVFIAAPKVNALILPGGSPSGCTGSCNYYTTNGFGWYSYDTSSGAGPEAWATGGPWSTVRSQCQAEGADRFDAFIVQRSGGNNSGNNAKVYRYNTSGFSTAWPGYKGNNGGNWLSMSTAQSQFNSIPNKGGYVFGVNVAGFCFANSSYQLTPTVTVSPSAGEGGSSVNVSPNVSNAGPTVSKSVTWELYVFNVAPGGVIPSGGVSALSGQSYYGNGATKVTNATRTFSKGNTALAVAAQRLADLPIGTHVCFGLSLRPYSSSDTTNARHSTPACVTIAKKPKIQIRGGDLIVGRNFVGGGVVSGAGVNTSQTVKYR